MFLPSNALEVTGPEYRNAIYIGKPINKYNGNIALINGPPDSISNSHGVNLILIFDECDARWSLAFLVNHDSILNATTSVV